MRGPMGLMYVPSGEGLMPSSCPRYHASCEVRTGSLSKTPCRPGRMGLSTPCRWRCSHHLSPVFFFTIDPLNQRGTVGGRDTERSTANFDDFGGWSNLCG